jgi:hypothetical protein
LLSDRQQAPMATVVKEMSVYSKALQSELSIVAFVEEHFESKLVTDCITNRDAPS